MEPVGQRGSIPELAHSGIDPGNGFLLKLLSLSRKGKPGDLIEGSLPSDFLRRASGSSGATLTRAGSVFLTLVLETDEGKGTPGQTIPSTKKTREQSQARGADSEWEGTRSPGPALKEVLDPLLRSTRPLLLSVEKGSSGLRWTILEDPRPGTGLPTRVLSGTVPRSPLTSAPGVLVLESGFPLPGPGPLFLRPILVPVEGRPENGIDPLPSPIPVPFSFPPELRLTLSRDIPPMDGLPPQGPVPFPLGGGKGPEGMVVTVPFSIPGRTVELSIRWERGEEADEDKGRNEKRGKETGEPPLRGRRFSFSLDLPWEGTGLPREALEPRPLPEEERKTDLEMAGSGTVRILGIYDDPGVITLGLREAPSSFREYFARIVPGLSRDLARYPGISLKITGQGEGPGTGTPA